MYILDLLVFLRSRIHAETTKLLLSAVSSIDAQTRTPHPHLHTHSGCMSLSSKYGWVDGGGGGGGVTAAEYNIDTLLTDVSTLAFLANARFALFQCGSSYPCEWVSQ